MSPFNQIVRGHMEKHLSSFAAAALALPITHATTHAQATPPAATAAQAISNSGSSPADDWPSDPKGPQGAPNVVLILSDDVGFSATSTFGGVIATPTFDRLAKNGLRYNAFHVHSLCSPTRAALLSGRNNHEVGCGTVAEAASAYPGYNAHWSKNAASLAEVLKLNGYSTAAFGKWHNTPLWVISSAGPFDRWPTNRGFEHFYGFIQGYDNQYFPRLFRDTVPVEALVQSERRSE